MEFDDDSPVYQVIEADSNVYIRKVKRTEHIQKELDAQF